MLLMPRDQRMTPDELADHWNMSVKTLAKWRCDKCGPAYIKIAGNIWYLHEDIAKYEQASTHGRSQTTVHI